MISFMKVLQQRVTKDNKEFRLVENSYRDDTALPYCDIFGYEYQIQIKFLFFWITIKSYNYTFDTENDNDEINKEIDYLKFLAEEYFEFIINN